MIRNTKAWPVILLNNILMAQTLLAQTNSLGIDGPSQSEYGKLVRLTAEIDPAESPFWIVLQPTNLDYEQVDNGKRLVFAVGCEPQREIVVMLLAQRVVDGRIVTRQLRRSIEVVGNRPEPVIDPGDPTKPPDDPVKPDPREALRKTAMYRSVLQAWPQIPTLEAKAKSLQVAVNFAEVGNQCLSGQIREREEIWRQVSAKNRQILGIRVRDWDVVAVALQTEFQKLKLGSIKEHAVYLKAAALAIEEASK